MQLENVLEKESYKPWAEGRSLEIKQAKVFSLEKIVVLGSSLISILAIAWSYAHGYIVAYGDAESHLNIAKRIASGLTPGFAQLGGIWLPLPHLLMIPFVFFDALWRTGLAGSIVSGSAFVITSYFLFKLTEKITGQRGLGLIASLLFVTNPNILYMQTTPMTELTLIVFSVISTYFFIKFVLDTEQTFALIQAAFFAFLASLSRYDAWFLVVFEALVVALIYFPWQKTASGFGLKFNKERWHKLIGRLTLYCTLATFGILLWFLWGFLILGDPLYFTHSQYSAKSQQQGWLARGELPSYHNIWTSFVYYFYTVMQNAGWLIFAAALLGFVYWLFDRKAKKRIYILLILLVPFIFNVVTLFLGQSVIFIPGLTPKTFQWQLFNVRYGVMMIPSLVIFAAYLLKNLKYRQQLIVAATLAVIQSAMFFYNYPKVLSLADGLTGLSSELLKGPEAQNFIVQNYDNGLVLEDDYSRTFSLIRTKIPMQNVIYIGNKPYWSDSLAQPQKYAKWIIMQKNDAIWTAIYDNPIIQGRLYKYFTKIYTSPDILIFKRNDVPNSG